MVGASLGLAGRYEPYRLICRWLNVKRPGRCAPLRSTGDGCCTWLFHIKQKHFVQQHAFLRKDRFEVRDKRYEGDAEEPSDRKPVGLPFRLQRENINMLSYFLTYSILLSTDFVGFETTACLKCLRVLNFLYMAGRSALKLEIGYCVP